VDNQLEPGSKLIPVNEELRRILPIIEGLRKNNITANIPISVDTFSSEVADKALEFGANMINDITGGTKDPKMLDVVAKYKCPFIIMHIKGNPGDVITQELASYDNLINEIYQFLKHQINSCENKGIPRWRLFIDPGIGFGKLKQHNLTILKELSTFKSLGCPILVGYSRKRFIGTILQENIKKPSKVLMPMSNEITNTTNNDFPPEERIWGGTACCSAAISGGAAIIRVHDVFQTKQVAVVADAIWKKQ